MKHLFVSNVALAEAFEGVGMAKVAQLKTDSTKEIRELKASGILESFVEDMAPAKDRFMARVKEQIPGAHWLPFTDWNKAKVEYFIQVEKKTA